MERNRKLALGGAGLLMVGGLTWGGVAMATGDGDSDGDEVTGQIAQQARQAAEEAVPGGTAGEVENEAEENEAEENETEENETGEQNEAGEQNAVYGVEVTKSDGSTVEVLLDEDFTVLDIEDEAAESDEDGDEE